MSGKRAARRLVPLTLASVIAGGGLCVPFAHAEASSPVSVTIGLAANDHAAVAHLAKHARLPHAQRVHRLLRAAPAAAAQQRQVVLAREQGLDVAGVTRFSVTVSGDAADAAAFAAQDRDDPAVAYVLVNDRPGFFKRQSELTGAVARVAYQSPIGLAPSGVQPTVATIQFSGWDAGDLSAYASTLGLPDPVVSGQYTAVSVDGADPAHPDGKGGEGEVALDQESLLATAPYLNQRAYFAPNNGPGGLIDALNRVASDALDDQHDYYNLTALSISYGGCELMWNDAALDALDDALLNVLASGVTVFAASGDDAGYDCWDVGDSDPGVILPAAHPLVVGVGGTTLDISPGFIDERAWYDPVDGSGGGGGVSQIYAEPAYQKLKARADGRVVPDIALDADPRSGFATRVNGTWTYIGGTSLASPVAAGTFSNLLAADDDPYGVGYILPNLYGAPASSFRDITQGGNAAYDATRGYDAVTGLGAPLWRKLEDSIVGAPTLQLPRFSRTRSVDLDVSVPQGMKYTEWKAGAGAEPTDCSTSGLTAQPPTAVTASSDGKLRVWLEAQTDFYCYGDSGTVFVDSHEPIAKAVADRTGARSARFSWSSSDHSPSSGISRYTVKIFRSGTRSPVYAETVSKASVVRSTKMRRGHTYTLRVTVTDRAGNKSDVAVARVAIPA
jgi:hypothetical protein